MNRSAKTALQAVAIVIVLSLVGCAADEATPHQAAKTLEATSATPPTVPSASPTPTPTPTHPIDPRDTAYAAEVAAWPDEIPPGFAWPAAITDLPAGRWHGQGDWSGYMTAAGVYHCMLVFAAWDAYFVDNDATASKKYAARADATMPEQKYMTWVSRDDGTIGDQELARESGICNGFVGDLRV